MIPCTQATQNTVHTDSYDGMVESGKPNTELAQLLASIAVRKVTEDSIRHPS